MIPVASYCPSAQIWVSIPIYLLCPVIKMMMDYRILFCFNVFISLVLAGWLKFYYCWYYIHRWVCNQFWTCLLCWFPLPSGFTNYIPTSCVKNYLLIFNILRTFFNAIKTWTSDQPIKILIFCVPMIKCIIWLWWQLVQKTKFQQFGSST